MLGKPSFNEILPLFGNILFCQAANKYGCRERIEPIDTAAAGTWQQNCLLELEVLPASGVASSPLYPERLSIFETDDNNLCTLQDLP